MENSTVKSAVSGLYILAMSAAILLSMIYGQSILVPIIVGIVIAFVIDDIALQCARVTVFGNNLPPRVARIMAIIVIFAALAWITLLALQTGNEIAGQLPSYRDNIGLIIDQVPDTIWSFVLGESATDVDAIITQLFELGTAYVTDSISVVANNLLNFLVQAFIVFFYVLFLMSEQKQFGDKVEKMFPHADQKGLAKEIISSIADQSRKYISVKTYVSLATGIGSYLVMLFFGVEFAVFWAVLIFVFNYIPYVGSIVAVVFPVTIALLQFGTLTTPLFLLLGLTLIQILVGYILEPIVMGNSLDISTFVVLVSLSFFGAIWGIVGMIIAIPLVIIMIIVLGHFERTRPVAVLLTGKGDLNFEVAAQQAN